MVVRVSDKKQTYNNVTKLLVKPLKNKKASKIPLYEDGEGYQFEYIHKQ